MRIYFSGIGGVGIGPLAQIAQKAGYAITGSDLTRSLTSDRLAEADIPIEIGEQTGDFLRREHASQPFDYFVYTAALPPDHPELVAAHQLGIMCLKRDGMIARLIDQTQLRMIAIAGTHGKTTTSGLTVWVMQQLGLPVSYSVGTTLSYGPSGDYDPASKYFIYECDEYDRNFLHFTPHVSLITSIDYDHPDTYPTEQDYRLAFTAFIDQSGRTLMWDKDYDWLEHPDITSELSVFDTSIALDHIKLPGIHLRQNAFLVERLIMRLYPDTPYHDLIEAINTFPGTDRRMERLADGLYTDYGHHPSEIRATLQLAHELSEHVVLVYQPHQNIRQHELARSYTDDVFADADEVYWLPTYLSRENPALEILTPRQLTTQLSPDKIHYASLDDDLWQTITTARNDGNLVLCMGAGSIDGWVRERLTF